jgi:transcriptional regulator with XRE-family HTH domain
MATRAKIHIARREEGVSFSEIPEKIMVSIYNHYDGYPEGLGVTLASYLDDYKITNGLGRDNDYIFNGLGCLAASLIAELKDGPGNVYIEDPERPHGWIDYEYYVWGDDNKDIWISIFDGSECIFVGKPLQLLDKYS